MPLRLVWCRRGLGPIRCIPVSVEERDKAKHFLVAIAVCCVIDTALLIFFFTHIGVI